MSSQKAGSQTSPSADETGRNPLENLSRRLENGRHWHSGIPDRQPPATAVTCTTQLQHSSQPDLQPPTLKHFTEQKAPGKGPKQMLKIKTSKWKNTNYSWERKLKRKKIKQLSYPQRSIKDTVSRNINIMQFFHTGGN